MSAETIHARYDRETILSDLVRILGNMTADWEVETEEGIRPEARLIADLGFESIDMVQLIVAVEEHYQRRDLPFEELLMADGRYVDDLYVREVVEFLGKHLNAA